MRTIRRAVPFVAQFQPDHFRPPSTPRINNRAISCPVCRAEIGEPCISASGKETLHIARHRMAFRNAYPSTDKEI